MKKLCIVYFIILSGQLFSQVPYRPKFLIESEFPRRTVIGIKLLSSKKLAFTLKSGYQLPFIHFGEYDGAITKPWSLLGPVVSVGSEFNFKNPARKILIEFEYGNLTGSYQYPYKFNVGRDYDYYRSNVKSQNYTSLIGYKMHLNRNYNVSLFFKAGLIYREAIENVYYHTQSRLPGSQKNDLAKPYNKYYYETEFTFRIGFQYCFGHSKLNPNKIARKKTHKKYPDDTISIKINGKKNIDNYPEINIYLTKTDSLLNNLYNNYQYSLNGYIHFLKNVIKLEKKIEKSQKTNDSILAIKYFKKFKDHTEKEILDRAMKPDTYKKVKTYRSGEQKIIRIDKEYYRHRRIGKTKALYN